MDITLYLYIVDVENSGPFVLGGFSQKQADEELYDWVCGVWELEWPNRKMPKNHKRAIEAYFEDPCEDSAISDKLTFRLSPA